MVDSMEKIKAAQNKERISIFHKIKFLIRKQAED